MVDQSEATYMQTKQRIHYTELDRSPAKPMMWARRAMIALVLVCESYFIVDIVRIVWMTPGY